MPDVFSPPPAAGLELGQRAVYGPGYRLAREAAFRRSGGRCQLCGRRQAQEAHHWALRYPADDEVTSDDLTALCRQCHWLATLQRLLDRTGEQPVWLVLATPTFPASPPRDAHRSRGGRQRVPRRQPRGCAAPERPSPSGPSPGEPALALRTLVERCHLKLIAGCLRCERFVPLDSTPHFRRHGWSGSVGDLRRGLCCCRCRSRTQWVLLGGWPSAGSCATTGRVAPRGARP